MSLTEQIYHSAPTTIKGVLIKMLVSNGMFAKQAQAVFARFQASDVSEPMDGRWDDPTEGYPLQMLAILRMGIRQEALRYIDETCPKAWFRPMFAEPEAAQEADEEAKQMEWDALRDSEEGDH